MGNFSGSQATWDDKTSDIEALVAKHAEVPTLAEPGVGFEEKPAKETISMAIPGNIARKYMKIWPYMVQYLHFRILGVFANGQSSNLLPLKTGQYMPK